ncbi:MAG: hypothetical protein IPO80_12905 [Propionibacteriaceae bacterium]|nr:hypothetical protein [Propionibacteriaceae bacterium]
MSWSSGPPVVDEAAALGGDEGSCGAGVRRHLAVACRGDKVARAPLAFEESASGWAVEAAGEFGDDGFAVLGDDEGLALV